jgi:outer membrane protein assembly factor BamB
MVNGTGIGQCIDVKSGKVLWKQRIGNAAEGFSNSPVAAEGHFYVLDEEGACSVIAADAKFKVLAKNKLDERCLTSPAISDGQIFIRTDHHLYCIGGGKSG